ncbi:MAG: glycosyltransferase family 2 protein [Planctomycetota bacterium]
MESMTPQQSGTQADAVDQHDRTEAGPAISILIVGYNTKDLVLDCLRGLYQHTAGPSFEVLFIDCSNDGSEQAIRDSYPDVRVIDNDKNLGFGRGNNFLAAHARGDYVLLLNPDTLIKDNAIGALYDFARSTPEAGAWGGVTRLSDGSIDPGCQQAAPGLGSGLMMLLGMGSKTKPDVEADHGSGVDVASLSGAFMMLRRELWEELGGFDESFFMYCEETDLCYRVRQAGRKVLITPRSSIVHLVGSGSAQSPKRMLALTRGGMHLVRKHNGPARVFIDGTLRWLYSASRYALGLIGAPLIGKDRAAELRQRHAPIVCHPGQWFRGWSQTPTPSLKTEPTSA